MNTESFVKRAQEIHNNRYDYSKAIYKSAKTKVEIVCKEHGSFWQTADTHIHGHGCNICAIQNNKEKIRNRLSVEFLQKVSAIHGNRYDYSKVKYEAAKLKVEIICKEHGSFWQRPDIHINGRGCPKCGVEIVAKTKRLTIDEFIEKAIKVHENRYDYSKVNYIKSSSKVAIICHYHGTFFQTPNGHLNNGCKRCSDDARRLSLYSFKQKALQIHDNKYDYSNVKYVNAKTKVEINCPTHGVFFQTPEGHLYSGYGCKKCGNDKTGERLQLSRGEFIDRATIVHENKYNYDRIIFNGLKSPIEIICPTHGVFFQTASNHLCGYGCKRCSRYKSQDRWLDEMGVPNNFYHRQVAITLDDGSKIVADGYIKESNTIYEYWGSYFHGHPKYYDKDQISFTGKTFGELYEKTQNKINAIKSSGYNLIQQWAHHTKDGQEILFEDTL